jgi:hypothetical protein
MSDQVETSDDERETELPEQRLVPEGAFATFENLLALVADARTFKKRLHGLHRALTAVDGGQVKLADDRTQHEARLAADRAELEEERASLQRRRADVEAKEAAVAERHRHIAELEAAWRNLGEPDAVKSGFQSPEFTPLQKARRAFTGRSISSERFGQTTLTRDLRNRKRPER